MAAFKGVPSWCSINRSGRKVRFLGGYLKDEELVLSLYDVHVVCLCVCACVHMHMCL